MRAAPGVGLAAPQLGEALRACVVEVEGRLHELVNPRIVRADGEDRDLEGCLSIPGYVAYVTRPERVWVVAQNRVGRKFKVSGSGLLGRALQHELDHLDGKLYIDYLDSMDELIAVGQDETSRTRRSARRRAPSRDDPAGRRSRPGGVPGQRRVRRADPAMARDRSGRGSRRRGHRPAASGRSPGGARPRPRSARLPQAWGSSRCSRRPSCAPRTRSRRSWRSGPRLAVLADYGQIVPPALLELPHGALNLHPSALPRWRGASPIPATILAGDVATAVTLMRMDAGLDTGPLDRPRGAAARRHRDRARARGQARRPRGGPGQPLPRALAAGRARRDVPGGGRGDADPTAAAGGRAAGRGPAGAALERQVRAYLPWPGSFAEIDGDAWWSRGRRVAASRPGRRRRPPRARQATCRPSRPPTAASCWRSSRRAAGARCPARTTCAATARPG